jgi:tricorn protease
MNWKHWILLACIWLSGALAASAAETRLMRFPDVSKDSVAFTYAGDIWVVPRAGGKARRLTAHLGEELFPKFSPDGRWIAFTGQYDGNADVYVIPAEGGEPRRLTYHPAEDMVLGWTPDSRKVLFRSSRTSYSRRFQKLFLVTAQGGFAEELPLPRGGPASFSPDGQRVAYNPVSTEFRTWKRYRGGWLMYIGLYDLRTNHYEELPRVKANDAFPMWHGDAIYFASDRDGVMNLYRYDLRSQQTKQLTHYKEYDVKWPSLGPDAIAYENGGYLYLLDLKSERSQKVPVEVDSDMILARPEIRTVERFIRTYDLSPSGARAVFEARGEIFTVPAKHGDVRNITNTPGVHELDPAWSPDGKWIAYLSDRTGKYELYIKPQDGTGEEIRITSDGDCYRYSPIWSPDSKKLLYSDKKQRLWYVDVDQKRPIMIDQSNYSIPEDSARPPSRDWSPDSRWVAYVKGGTNRYEGIYLYALEQKKIYPVTGHFFDNSNPRFDPEGKVLYFLSNRNFAPIPSDFDRRFNYNNTVGIYAVTLQADAPSPYAPESDEEKGEKGKEEKKAEDKAKSSKEGSAEKDKEKEKPKAEIKPLKIDVDGIDQRIVAVPMEAGNFRALEVGKGKLFYLSVPVVGLASGGGPQPPRNVLHVFDIKERQSKVLLPAIDDYRLNREGDKVLYRAQQTFGIVEAVPEKAKVGEGKLNTAGLQARVDPRAEWAEIFREAWRIERDFYYAPNMAGYDWEKIGQRYEQLLPYVGDRSDLNYIIGEMIAELSTSHAYVGGGDVGEVKRINVGLLGADLEPHQGFYRFKKIYQGQNWDARFRAPLTEPGVKVRQGDYLIAVNGQTVRATEDPHAYFQNLADKIVTLKINSQPSEEGAWNIEVKLLENDNELRYLDWVEGNRRKVAEATGGRVGYVHVPDTALDGLNTFTRYFYPQTDKEALIVDERFNSGGFIPDFFTEVLGRKLLSMWAPREGVDFHTPVRAIFGPKVMLINEYAGSGGDAFPYYFRKEKLGPLVGKRTWGGLVGISRGIPLMDGGFVTAPEFAFWSIENGGEWAVENIGVPPDYEVDQRPDLEIKGHDPQLEKAIELILETLKKGPPAPRRPAYPGQRLVSK